MSLCFVPMAHRAVSEWQGKCYREILVRRRTEVFILLCNKPQNCPWGADPFTSIFSNSQQLREDLASYIQVSPSTKTTKLRKKHQHVTNSPDIQLWFLGALCEQSCTSKNPYLISFRCQPDGQGSLLEKQCFKGSRTDTWNSSNADANLSPPLPNMSHWATSSSTYSLPSFQLSLFCPLCKISVPLIHFYIEVMNNTTQLYLTVENTCICNWKPSGNLGREQDIKAEALLKGSLENLRKQ